MFTDVMLPLSGAASFARVLGCTHVAGVSGTDRDGINRKLEPPRQRDNRGRPHGWRVRKELCEEFIEGAKTIGLRDEARYLDHPVHPAPCRLQQGAQIRKGLPG